MRNKNKYFVQVSNHDEVRLSIGSYFEFCDIKWVDALHDDNLRVFYDFKEAASYAYLKSKHYGAPYTIHIDDVNDDGFILFIVVTPWDKSRRLMRFNFNEK